MEAAVRDLIESEARLGSVSSLHLSNVFAEVPKNAESSLCVGDVVMITAPIDCYETSEQLAPLIDLGTQAISKRAFASTTVFLEAEGVADPQVHAVEKGTGRLHTCLFTVLSCLYQKDSDAFSRKSEKEFDAKTQGEQVHFGDEVQLRHLNSGKFMSFSSTPAAFGFQITLEERMGRSTWIRLVGGAKSTKVGQPVYYHNRVVFQTKCDFIEYYMHLSGSSLPMLHFAVTAYSEPFSWTLSKFQSPPNNESEIQLMRPVIFSHKDLGLKLSHMKRPDEEWKRVPDLFNQHDSNKEADILCDVTHEEENRLMLSGSVDDGMGFWRIEDPSQSHGGTVEPNKPYLLRNVLTGEYLGKELNLGPEGAVFTLATTKVQTKSLVNGIDVVLKLEDGHLEAELDDLSGKDVFRMIPCSSAAQIRGAAQVILGRQSSESSRFTFEVYNLSKHLSTFVEKTVELVPVFQGFYNTLANWGVVDSKIQELAALQQLKELRLQRDIVLRALKFLEEQLTQNVMKEILEERQAFLVACNIHILLIRIAQMLMLRLGTSEQKQLRLTNLTPGIEQILEQETRDLVAAMMSLLNFTAFENPTVCKHLTRIDKEICTLFPLNQRLVASLLAEIYRLIDPPIEDYEAYFANWLGRLETLSQTNAEEQTVFLRLIRHLSEEGNEVNPASQLQLVQHLLQGPSPFKLLKVSMLEDEAYVHFYEKDEKPLSVPDLESIKRQIGSETNFPLAQMQGPLLKYAKYVAEALLLLNTLCKNDNKESLQCVSSELGLTAQTVLRLSNAEHIHIIVRRSFVFLASTVVLARDCLGLLQTSGTISFPEAEEGDQSTYVRSSNTQVEELSRWCFVFWMHNSALNKTGAEASDLLDFLQSILLLTSTLVDYKIAKPAFAAAINPAVEYLFICLVNPNSRHHTEPHWVDELVQQATENTLALAYRRKRVIQASISLIKLNYIVSSRTKVQSILNCYLKYRGVQFLSQEQWYAKLHALIVPDKNIVTQMKANAMTLLYAKAFSNDSRDFSIREPKITEFVSELLLSNVKLSQDTRNLLFDLLRSVLTINLTISTQVTNTQLLDLPKLQEYRETLVHLSGVLQIEKQETVLRIVFERYDQAKADQVRFHLEKLFSVLCSRKKLARDILAIQNIARDLYLHKELVKLWEILQVALSHTNRKDNKLKAKDLTRILSLTVYCLYYFALGHEENRQEALKLMQPDFYSVSVRVVPYLIQELTDFEHISQHSAWLCYQSVLQKCTFSSPTLLPGLEWIRISMQYRGSTQHASDLQGIAAMAILAHLQKLKVSLLSPSDSESMSEMISLLAEAADGNEPVRKQCKALVSPALLKECFKSAIRPSLVRAWTHLLQTVYLGLAQEDLAECLHSVLPWLQRVAQASKSLISLGIDGLYDQVFPTNTPEHVDLKEGGTIYENANLELWTMVSSGDEWAVKYGLCYSLPRILVAQSPPSEDFKNLCTLLQNEILNINQIVFRLEKNYEQLDCSLLRKASFGCYKAFSLYLRGELDKEAVEGIFEMHQMEEEVEQTRVEDVPAAPPIFLKFKQVLPLADSMLLTKAPSLKNQEEPLWEVFTRTVQLACREHTLMPADATRILALQVPLVKKLTSSTMNNRERQDTVKAIKTMIKKLKSEYQSEVFIMLKVILEESKSKSTTAEVFRDAGVLATTVQIIVAQRDLKLMSAATELLNEIMTHRSIAFQDLFLTWLTESETYVRLFQLIVNELSCSLDRMGHPEHLAPSERAFLSQYFTHGKSVTDLRTLNQNLIQQLLELAKLCCDNCNPRFQTFMSVQNKPSDSDPLAAERESIDLVSAVANYLVCVCQGEFTNNGEALMMLEKCLETLVEFVTGPCEDNQTRLGSDVQLIKALDVLLRASYERRDRASWVSIMLDALCFLHACLEGHPTSEVLDTLLKHLNINELLNALVQIYQHEIQSRETHIMLEEESENSLLQKPRNDVAELIDVGFNIMMLLLKLQNLAPTHPDLVVLKSIGRKSEYGCLDLKLGVLNHLPHECYAFYASLIGYVEISRNGAVEADFFKIPYKCKFLTVETKGKAIFKAMDASHHQKIQNFLHLTKLYKVEMDHQQHLYRIGWLKQFSQGWKIYGWVSFLFILAINIALLSQASYNEVSYVDSEERKAPVNLFTICLGLLQLLFALVSYLCYLAEYYPNLAHNIVLNKVDSLEFPDYAEIWHNDSVLMKRESSDKGNLEDDKTRARNFIDKAINVCTNVNTLYNICFLTVSSVSIVIPALYAVLLLDVFKRSEELVNIVRAVTQNKKQLVLTVIVGIIIVYMFSMAGIVGFQDYFAGNDNSMYCSTLWECFISEIHMGTRAGGGVADQLTIVTLGDRLYYPRILYDMLFFAIVVLIIQNIIFGIIVDTFGELRDKREQVLEELNTECYVCGVSRSVLERSGKGWAYHFLNEHSLFAYMAFITYIEEKDESDCTGLEKYVKDKIRLKDTSFFPSTSKYLQDMDVDVSKDE